jgi:predicted ATPase
MGDIARADGDLARAVELQERSVELCRGLDDEWLLALTLSSLSQTLVAFDPRRAAAIVAESLRLAGSLGNVPRIANCAETLAAIAAGEGELEQAARLLGKAAALREAVDVDLEADQLEDHARTLEAVRGALGDERFRGLEDEGRTLPDDALLEYAEAGASPVGPRPTGLPLPPTPLVGRARELEELATLLGRAEVRLVTLTGAGGTGKTRLALALAERVGRRFRDGVRFLQLAPVSEPELVLPTVAAALGASPAGAETVEAALTRALADSELLLVLDNFEQLLPAAPAVAQLLAACPGLVVVATSRAPLRIQAEHEYAVPPLSAVEGTDLFRARALARDPGFAAPDDRLQALVERLDCLPLALELAAARVRLLGFEELRRRLEQMLPLLSGGARDLPERQRTLRAAIAWSEELLAEEERSVFARLSVFAGSFSLEAAEAVCGAGLDTLAALVEHSLVRRADAAEEGEPSFRLLHVIREYGAEALRERGEDEQVAAAHASWYADLAERSEPEQTGPEQAAWMRRLEREHENMRAALAFAERHGATETIARIAAALWRFWNARGHLSEGRRWLGAAIAREDELEPRLRARVLNGAGILAQNQDDFDGADEAYEGALRLYRELEDRRGVAAVLLNLGVLATYRGRLERAADLLEESLALFREDGDAWRIAVGLGNLGLVSQLSGDYERATALYEESLGLRRELGDERGIVMLLHNLGRTALEAGEVDRASELIDEAVALSGRLGDAWGIAYAGADLGLVALARGRHETALAQLAESVARWRELGRSEGVSDALAGLGLVLVSRLGDGDAARAVRFLAASERLREDIGAAPDRALRAQRDAALETARTELGDEEFARAWEEGHAQAEAVADEAAAD